MNGKKLDELSWPRAWRDKFVDVMSRTHDMHFEPLTKLLSIAGRWQAFSGSQSSGENGIT